MREDEKKCVRCGRKFKNGDQLIPVYDYYEHERGDFVTQSMYYVHLIEPPS